MNGSLTRVYADLLKASSVIDLWQNILMDYLREKAAVLAHDPRSSTQVFKKSDKLLQASGVEDLLGTFQYPFGFQII